MRDSTLQFNRMKWAGPLQAVRLHWAVAAAEAAEVAAAAAAEVAAVADQDGPSSTQQRRSYH